MTAFSEPLEQQSWEPQEQTGHNSECNAFFYTQGEDGVPGEDGRKVCGCLWFYIIWHQEVKMYEYMIMHMSVYHFSSVEDI